MKTNYCAYGTLVAMLPLLAVASCEDQSEEKPFVRISGSTSWVGAAPADTLALLNTFTRSFGTQWVTWPPASARRTVDISFDVSGSGFWERVRFEGKTMALAEYNIRTLHATFASGAWLQPGDHVVFRYYGERFGPQSASGREKVEFDLPSWQLRARSRVLSRRNGSLQLTVDSQFIDTAATRASLDRAFGWVYHGLQQVSSAESYQSSPLLTHLSRIIDERRGGTSKSMVMIVTDGFFQVGGIDFSPTKWPNTESAMQELQEAVVRLNLRPFTVPEPKLTIVFTGLADGEDSNFKVAQERFLRWYFAPQPILIHRY
jgi:hypothetical protein